MQVQRLNITTNPVKQGSFCVYVMVPVGAIHETKQQSGCSHILEHMLFRNKHNADIVKRLTKIGGRYNAVTYFDVTYFFIRTTSEHANDAMQIMKDMVLRATFTKADLETERHVLLEEYHVSSSKPGFSDDIGYNALVDPKNLYSRTVIGSANVIKNITVQELKDYHKKHYKHPVVYITCDFDIRGRVARAASELFGPPTMVSHTEHEQADKAELIKPTIAVLIGHGPQVATRLSWIAFPASDFRNGVVLEFINHCLTGTLIYSLINTRMRIERGLVYTALSFIDKFRYIGFMTLFLRTSNKQTDYIISLVLDVIEKLKRHGLGSQKLLSFYKKSFINHIKSKHIHGVDVEDAALSTFYGGLEDKEYFKHKMDIAKSITNHSVKEICKHVFDYEKMGIITSGYYSDVNAMNSRIRHVIDSYYA